MDLGAPELLILAIVVFALFGYKKLPDASRAIGRSLRIFKGEMTGLKNDDAGPTQPPAASPRPAAPDA